MRTVSRLDYCSWTNERRISMFIRRFCGKFVPVLCEEPKCLGDQMQFEKVDVESLKLGDNAKVSKTVTRMVEPDFRLAQFIDRQESESEETTGKDFLATDLENCQKFNEEDDD